MNKRLTFFILAGLLIFLTGIAQARVSDMVVAVDGMACPFCAYGVEKRLKTVKGVATVAVDMKTGTANLTAKPELSIHFQEIPKAVKEAGFTPGVMKLTVSGTVETDKTSSYVLLFDGPSLLLESGDDKMEALLSDYSRSGKHVVLYGVLNRQRDHSWSVTPESIEEVRQ